MTDHQQFDAYGQPAYGGAMPAPGYAGAAGTMPLTGPGRQVGKVRNPWGVWLLVGITFGIYGLYWWYTVNREVLEYDRTIDVKPGLALLALFVPIANLVSLVRTGGRIAQAQRAGGTNFRCSGGLGFLFALLFSTHFVYYQSQLNKLWAQHGNLPPGTRVA